MPKSSDTSLTRGHEYVEHAEVRAKFRQDALASWDHYQITGLHLTAEEADIWFVKLEVGKNAALPKCRV
jgi:hypothetical protein